MTVLSPLARGCGSWQGDLESTKTQTVPVLKQCLDHGSSPRYRAIDHPVRIKSSIFRQSEARVAKSLSTVSSNPRHHRRTKSASIVGQGDGPLELPKTFLTRKGALMLFSSPKNIGFSKEDNERCYFYDPDDVARQSALQEMRTVDKLTDSVFQFVNQQQVCNKLASPRSSGKVDKSPAVQCTFEDSDLRTQPGGDFGFYLKNVQSQANFRHLLRSPDFRSLVSEEGSEDPLQTNNGSALKGCRRESIKDVASRLKLAKVTEDISFPAGGDSVMRGNKLSRPSSGRSLRSSAVTPISVKEISASIKSSPYLGRPPSTAFQPRYTTFIPTPPSSVKNAEEPSDNDYRSEQQSQEDGHSSRCSAQSQRSRRSIDSKMGQVIDGRLPRDSDGRMSVSLTRQSSSHLSSSSSSCLPLQNNESPDIGSEAQRPPSSRHSSPCSLHDSAGGSPQSSVDIDDESGVPKRMNVTLRSEVTSWSKRSLVSAGSRTSKISWVIGDSLIDEDDGEIDWKSDIIDVAADENDGWEEEQVAGGAFDSSSGINGEMKDAPGGSSGMDGVFTVGDGRNASRPSSPRKVCTPRTQPSGGTTPYNDLTGEIIGLEHVDREGISSRGSARNSERNATPVTKLADRTSPQEVLDGGRSADERHDIEETRMSSRASSGSRRRIYVPGTTSGRTTPMEEATGGSSGMDEISDVGASRQSSRVSSASARGRGTLKVQFSERTTPGEEYTGSQRPLSSMSQTGSSSGSVTVGANSGVPADLLDNCISTGETYSQDVPTAGDDAKIVEEGVAAMTASIGADKYDVASVLAPDGLKCTSLVEQKGSMDKEDSMNSMSSRTIENRRCSTTETNLQSEHPTIPATSNILGCGLDKKPTDAPQQTLRTGALTVLTVPPEQPKASTSTTTFSGSLEKRNNSDVITKSSGNTTSKNTGRKSPARSGGKKITFGGPQFEYVNSMAIDPFASRPSREDVDDMVAAELAKELAAQNLLEDKKGRQQEQKDEVDSLATDDEAIEEELKKTGLSTSSKKKENRKKIAKQKAALMEARRSEKERRKEEMQALQEKKRQMEEERRRLEAEEKRRQEELAETIAEAEREAEMAKQAEEDARQMMQEARRIAREERDARRKEEGERRRLERERQKEERIKMEESARQREKEMADRLASAEERRAMQEAARLEREEQERLEQEERDRLEEEEQMRQEMEEERIRQLERQAEREAMERLVREREAAEENKRQAELLMKQKQEADERKRQEELELKAKEEARLLLLKIAEDQKRELELEKIRQIQQLEEEARAKVRRELARRRAAALHRREQNLEHRGHMNGLRRTQGMTKPWVFSYYIHWPRDSYERRLPSGDDKKKRRPRTKTAPPLTADVKKLVSDTASAGP